MCKIFSETNTKFDKYFLLPLIAAIILGVLSVPIAIMDSIANLSFSNIGIEGAVHKGLLTVPRLVGAGFVFSLLVSLVLTFFESLKNK